MKTMFREMRRSRQSLCEEECARILERETSGTLAVFGDEGYPYCIPLSYVYADSKLYFHSAKTGHKTDALARCDKASFCVIAEDRVLPEKFTTLYKSVIVFGRAKVVTDDKIKRSAIEKLAAKYSPGFEKEGFEEIEKEFERFLIIELSPEHITGKQAKELIAAVTDRFS